MKMIAIPDALDAMQRNIKLFLDIATGGKAGTVSVSIDVGSGTASIYHVWENGKCNAAVRFPALPSQHRLTADEVDRWTAYFVHELCHAIYTDPSAWQAAVREGLQAIVNGLEDVRIERAFNAAGTAANSAELLTVLMRWAVSQCPKNYDPNDMKQLPWMLAMFGRVRICGYAIPGVAKYDAMLSRRTRTMLDWTMAELDRATSTHDVLEIARKLKKALANPKPVAGDKPDGDGKDMRDGDGDGDGDGGSPEEKLNDKLRKLADAMAKQASKADGEPSGDGEASKADGEASGDGDASKADGEPSGDGDASKADGEPSGDGEPTEGDSEGKAGSGRNGAGKGTDDAANDKLAPFDITRCAEVKINPMSAATKQANDTVTLDAFRAQIERAVIEGVRAAQETAGKPFERLPNSRDGTAAALMTEAAKAGKLKAQVARVLKSEESETWERARPTGRLDRFAFAKMASGDSDIFAKRNVSGGYQTEIEILCDGSGSMTGEKAQATATLAIVIAQAAAQVGVKCGVSRFTTGKPRAVKLPNENVRMADVQTRLATLGYRPTGMTDLTGAIVQASAKLAARAPGKRKMLFVVSDGDCQHGPEGVRSANAYARRLDVETVVLCIDTPAHAGFGLAVECSSSNVTATGLGTLARALARD